MPRGLRCWGRSKGAVPQETSASESDGVERTSSSKARRAHATRQQDLPQYHDILAAANLKQKSITERGKEPVVWPTRSTPCVLFPLS
jgi:hypothetical protein